ncbi:hypothetical protein WICPIJ_008206 [Wickerhamomyces pijperi]|uniref:Uncharacterized protein n=1 Tax=Wickerhamomyces pijperi TaxID=599730 RepID=A0A9P8TJG6_WICPI|nr:hypothetical protein WICPIJ_008206 [Wickerhamomyces pijperi]
MSLLSTVVDLSVATLSFCLPLLSVQSSSLKISVEEVPKTQFSFPSYSQKVISSLECMGIWFILMGKVNHSFHFLVDLKATYEVVTGMVNGSLFSVTTTEAKRSEAGRKFDSFFNLEACVILSDSVINGLRPSREHILTRNGISKSLDKVKVTFLDSIDQDVQCSVFSDWSLVFVSVKKD